MASMQGTNHSLDTDVGLFVVFVDPIVDVADQLVVAYHRGTIAVAVDQLVASHRCRSALP